MSEKTYVLGEDEVRPTGRKARKPMPTGKFVEVHEVTPVNEYTGTWKKWVQLSALFEILPGEGE